MFVSGSNSEINTPECTETTVTTFWSARLVNLSVQEPSQVFPSHGTISSKQQLIAWTADNTLVALPLPKVLLTRRLLNDNPKHSFIIDAAAHHDGEGKELILNPPQIFHWHNFFVA